MSVKYGKRDSNHAEIKEAAERMGAIVIDTPDCGQTCPGFPDMVWLVRRQRLFGAAWKEHTETWFIEVKDGHGPTLTTSEITMRAKIRGADGNYRVVRGVEDVERLLRR